MTLTEVAMRLTDGDTWYVTAAAVLLIAFLLMRFVFKRIKWSIIIIVFALFVFLAYGKLFSKTFESVPEGFDPAKAREGIEVLYTSLQTRALRVFQQE